MQGDPESAVCLVFRKTVEERTEMHTACAAGMELLPAQWYIGVKLKTKEPERREVMIWISCWKSLRG